jgi:hypothetical protein
MAFKMKNPSVMKMAKEAGAAMKMKAPMKMKKESGMKMKKESSMKLMEKTPKKMKSPMKKDKDKHAGGVIGGKSRKGDVVTNQKDVAMRRINAMDITPEMKQRMIKDLKVESMGQRTTGKGK